ncbi:hypothetical protein K7I03_04730 [Streptomyces mobaraensis]|uniref:hypothetical protein n=2 Tax=Streptomyces TaxID=1883 RepID=UPI001CD01013|nr:MULTISPECIES: hypothetical protein [Streptomyces]UBI40968.1 hypothetical protein K7I03_04730 [Streptomyces mobaraensis]UKW33448.1 hypothetical protein MCU78_04730 [Streptomyces sp. TYQ1024]
MVFGNIFGFAQSSAGLFSVKTGAAESQPGADVDFEDAQEDTYDDKNTSLFVQSIHGASSRAKVVREQSPEARVIMGILGSFIQTTKDSARTQSQHAHADSVSGTASAGMSKASETVKREKGLQKNEDLQDKPDKEAYAKAPKAPEPPTAAPPPKAPPAAAEPPQKLGETQTTKTTETTKTIETTETTETTTEEPSGSQ